MAIAFFNIKFSSSRIALRFCNSRICFAERIVSSSILTSFNYQKEAAKVGFDWPNIDGAFEKFEEEEDINPENISKEKTSNSDNVLRRKNVDDVSDMKDLDAKSEDLDVPGSDLDDAQEEIGSEDEENNYYSLGGDDHED